MAWNNKDKFSNKNQEEWMMVDESKRVEPRFKTRGEAKVVSLADAEYIGPHGRQMHCSVQEVSGQGLRLGGLPVSLAEDSILKLNIELDGETYELTGCVRWCEQVGEEDYSVGWLLYDAEYTDMDRWQEFCDRLN